MRKKSEGLSLTTIVIAALVLIVLIVLIAIFSGRINIFGKTYTETQKDAQSKVCWSQGGRCVGFGECTGRVPIGNFVDCGDAQVCCIQE